ncbi:MULTISPECIES: PaaI family thioesterase [Streptomyces]|uniref:PaaI family thioesterase n=1 Tax=Streptomyces TaxID=1883 RepID=UPI003F4D84C7
MEDRLRQEPASPSVRKRVQDSFGRQVLMSHLGARLAHIGPGRVHVVLPARPEVTQQHGYVHAGATSAIADSAGGYAALTLFDEGPRSSPSSTRSTSSPPRPVTTSKRSEASARPAAP